MRIGFDGKRICCNQRGLGNYGRNLVDSLTITHPELECTLFSPQRAGPALQQWESSFLAQPNHHLVTPTGAWALWGSGWRTIKPASLAAKDQLDIYHGLSHELPWGISQSGIKSVVTIHDLLYLRLPQHYSLIDRTVYHQKVLYSCRHADQIVAIGQQTKQDLIQLLAVPPERIEVIYQSCHPDFYHQLPQQDLQRISAKYQLPNEYLLYVGAITPAKNIAAIIHALSLLPSSIELPLVIVGHPTSYQLQLEQLIQQLNLKKRVIFLTIPQKDLPAIYQLATLFTFPSLFEGFGIPIIEALFSGTPVLTTQEPVFTEAGGNCSLYVNPNDYQAIANGIVQIIEDQDLQQQMSVAGREHAERFHYLLTAQHMFELYQRIVNS